MTLMFEALAMLMLTSALIALVPFQRVATMASAGRHRRPATPAQARMIESAIEAWARRVPWRAVCFQCGLAAQFMLRRRKLSAALHYGAARIDDGRLVAHVWIRSGDVDVIGHRTAGRYTLLATFPDERRTTPSGHTRQHTWPRAEGHRNGIGWETDR